MAGQPSTLTAEPAEAPAREPLAWSAWTVWRGDIRLLVHTARIAEREPGGSGEPVRLPIEVLAWGDSEEFESADALIERLTRRPSATPPC